VILPEAFANPKENEMSEDKTCPNGHEDCDFPERHELALAGRILRVIEKYSEDNRTYPCPGCLRNSIMAIAALLHLEAAKADEEEPAQTSYAVSAGFVETFAETARERMLSIMESVAGLGGMSGKGRLM